MDTVDLNAQTHGTEQFRWERGETVIILAAYRAAPGLSQREFAQQRGVPRSTLQHWLDRKASLDLEPELADFFESPAGLAFLHRLMVAVHLVFEENCSCGLRPISRFLELTGLNGVLASSYGSRQKLSVAMETEIIAFAEQERSRLGTQMPMKDVALCEDETFHPRPCLVAIEPVSGYIPVETYCDGRDAVTWNRVVQEGLEGLAVHVVQCVSDEAGGLRAHARDGLGAHHSPDLFHVQQELSGATAFPLTSQTRRAEEELKAARIERQRVEAERDACHSQCPQSEVGLALDQQVAETAQREAAAEARLAVCQERAQRVGEARRGLGNDYHPFDTVTGTPCEAEEVSRRLNAHFDEIERVAREASLSERCQKEDRLARWPRRVLVAMLATIAFFWRSGPGAVGDTVPVTRTRAGLRGMVIVGALLPAGCREGIDGRTTAGVACSGRASAEPRPRWTIGRITGGTATAPGASRQTMCGFVPAFEFVRGGPQWSTRPVAS